MNKVVESVTKFTETRYMRILVNGFIGITAITICGSLFSLLKALPFQPWLDFLVSTGLDDVLSIPIAITTQAVSLYVVMSMAYQTAKSFEVEPFGSALVALGSFLLLTPFETVTESGETVFDVLPLSAIGSQGIFLAIFCGILGVRLYVFFIKRGWKIKMPESVPPNVSSMFESLIPGGLTFVVFLAIRYAMSVTPFMTAQNLIYYVLQAPLSNIGGGAGGAFAFLLASHALWLFGIHGQTVAYIGMAPIISMVGAENLLAFADGQAVPYPYWSLIAIAMLGGSGATLGLNLLMVSPICKSDQYKMLGKLALPTSIFNINEPLIFGMPMIMNPLMAIPFILTPLINFLIGYVFINIGFFVPLGANINSFMPGLVFGALVTGSWKGFVTQLIMLVIDTLIYLPFLRVADRNLVKQEKENKENEENESELTVGEATV